MSVYSTPLISISPNDSVSSEESAYFTPEMSFSPTTPQRSLPCNKTGSRRTKSVSDISDSTPGDSPLFRNHVSILLNNSASFHEKEWSRTLDKENHSCSTPAKKPIEFTPKRCRTTPLKCISNIVTPFRVKSNPLRLDEKMMKYEKESSFIPNINNNSTESSSFVYKNNLLNQKLKYRAKNVNKNKSTFLQRVGIRRKSKAEFDLLSEADSISLASNLSSCKLNDDVNLLVKDRRVPDILKLTKNESDVNIQCGISSKYPENNLKKINESYSSVLSQQKLTKNKAKMIWRNFYHPKVIAMKNIRLSPLKRLFTNCRKKLSLYPLKNLFARKPLEEKPANTVASTGDNDNKSLCLCSSTSLTNQELLSKILLKLNSLEEQISDIKSSIKNHGCGEKMSGNCLQPPPPPPLPPPPPPLPNLLSSPTEVMKRKLMTPNNGQPVKRQPLAKTQFAITVEDIKSVKLRKTPSTIKRSSAGTPLTANIKDGVLHSVKFKPVKRTVVQKKELSNLVSEILSPSKKTDQNERNCVLSAKLFEDKENQAISSNFEITPVKCKSKSLKFRSTKRRDLPSDSPSRKRLSNAYKTLVFCDNGVPSRD